jgi:hypothetical protein
VIGGTIKQISSYIPNEKKGSKNRHFVFLLKIIIYIIF